ncbi:MAG: protease modulator HflC [Phycisphaerales bacterium]|nr:protease modulator HflC [Phycisphaerales bacterium]
MTKNLPAIIVALIVLIVIACMMCAYQVGFTETVVVTRFERPKEQQPKEPGLYFKLPWPIDRVHRYDTRLRTFETEFRQVAAKESEPLILTTYATWRIKDGLRFQKTNLSESQVTSKIRGLVSNQVALALKRYSLSELVNVDAAKDRLADFERDILVGVPTAPGATSTEGALSVKDAAMQDFGVEVVSIGIKRLGLGEEVTKNVFDRMKAERDNVAKRLEAEGLSEAQKIREEAREVESKIRLRAEAYAKKLRGEGEAEAATYYAFFEKNRELADFLKKLETVEEILKAGRTTLVIDTKMIIPFEILSGMNSAGMTPSLNAPAGRTSAEPIKGESSDVVASRDEATGDPAVGE